MNRKKKKSTSGAKMVLPGWMASYGDMFTILMVFFVLLFTMSQIDQELFDRVMAGIQTRPQVDITLAPDGGGDLLTDLGANIMPNVDPPPPAGAPGEVGGVGDVPPTQRTGHSPMGDTVSDMMNSFMMYLAAEVPGGGEGTHELPDVDITEGEHYFRITLEADHMLFSSGQSSLLPDARDLLLYLAPVLHEFAEAGHGIIVEGHTDNAPMPVIGNRQLSANRAASVTDFLISNSDLSPRSIFPIGMSEYFPLNDNQTPAEMAANRRVEIKVFTAEATGGAVASWFAIPGTF
ncbi:MAG: flagellar motor protein MotB [Defluviitaleaceae bacterium]|nr:flagellar motor protein MotB [Defluviitaleaceae bacterium]